MAKYLLSVLRPNGDDPSTSLSEDSRREIDTLNDEMTAAGIRVFVGGLHSPTSAQCVRCENDGSTVLTEGPGLVASDYLDGFWVLECATRGDAVMWASKASRACRARIEVRPFY